jgi:hypothetical protein
MAAFYERSLWITKSFSSRNRDLHHRLLGFGGPDGTLSCNYEQIQWDGPYLQGIDNTTACFGYANGQMAGFRFDTSSSGLTGLWYAAADNIYDASCGCYTGFQWALLTQTVPSTRLHHYGWYGYLAFSGYEFLGNYGYLSAEIPGSSSKPVSNLSNADAARQSANRTKAFQK